MANKFNLCQLYRVIPLLLETGERLPYLVNLTTGFPVRLANRWAVCCRRYSVQSSTLASELRNLARLYAAAHPLGIDLDDYFTAGHLLSPAQLRVIMNYVRIGNANIDANSEPILADNSYYHCLGGIEQFLAWTLDDVNRGGICALSLEQLIAERSRLSALFVALREGVYHEPSRRIPPLTAYEIESIRSIIWPQQDKEGNWVFSEKNCFSRFTRLRNCLMFECTLQFGMRRGDMLKLRVDDLTRGSAGTIKIVRRPDDPHDSRVREPAVKTAARELPIVDRRFSSLFRLYLNTPPSDGGRVRGKTPYMFVSRAGDPLSVDAADDVIQRIGVASGVTPLSWHRPRHTWAEQMWSTVFAGKQDGKDNFMYAGGWTHPNSPKRYTENAIQQRAEEDLRSYQGGLYSNEEI